MTKYTLTQKKELKSKLLNFKPKRIYINDNYIFEVCYACEDDALFSIVCNGDFYDTVSIGHFKEFFKYCEGCNISFNSLDIHTEPKITAYVFDNEEDAFNCKYEHKYADVYTQGYKYIVEVKGK